MANGVLSLERMFWYRFGTLAAFAAFFYAASALGVPHWVSIPATVLAAIAAVLAVRHWSLKEDWLDCAIIGVALLPFFGATLALGMNDQRALPRLGWWSVTIFWCSACEIAFSLFALGAFGAKLSDPVMAIAIGVIVFAVQALVLACADARQNQGKSSTLNF